MFGDTKGAIRIRISKKNRQDNAPPKKNTKGQTTIYITRGFVNYKKGALQSQPQVILAY
jgi:hypothetical protein